MRVPERSNAAASTIPWCCKGGPIGSRVARSQSRDEVGPPARLPMKMVRPSGAKANAPIGSRSMIGGPRGAPVAASQSWSVLSAPPVAATRPSGPKPTAHTWPR